MVFYNLELECDMQEQIHSEPAQTTHKMPSTISESENQAVSLFSDNRAGSPVLRKMNLVSQVAQLEKGDADDPHEAHESKPVWLPKVTDAVVVPGLAGCAAMKINVFQHIEDASQLVASVVFHSEGKVPRSLSAAQQINQRIKDEGKNINISVDIFVMYNGAHKPATSDHAPVIAEIVKGFKGLNIQYREKSEIIKSSSGFITVIMTGTEEEIMERYSGRLKVDAPPEVVAYRKGRFLLARNAYVKNGVDEDTLNDWIYRWGNTETKSEVNALIKEANTEKPKKKKGLCYLTTACTQYAGLDDDCYELTALREFRDGYMQGIGDGTSMIQEYYDVAPNIVNAIELRLDKGVIYNNILNTVRRCVRLIEEKRFEETLSVYRSMVLELRKEFI